MQQKAFQLLAMINKAVLPSLTKRRVDPAKAAKWQLALLGWRAYVTKRAID